MKQKIGLFLCLALLLTGCSYQTKTIRFGAADIGGMYYICRVPPASCLTGRRPGGFS